MRNKTIKKVVSMAVIAAMGITSIVPASQADAAVKAKKLTVKQKKIVLYKGAAAGYSTAKLKVTVKPKKAKVTYKINKKKIASVSKKGVVKAKKPGKAKITVKAGKKKVVVSVVVKKITKKVTKITATKKLTVKVNKTAKIKTSVKPKKATLKKLTFTSNKKGVATVNAKGVVKGIKAGSAKITVKAVDGSKKKAVVSVIVTGAAVTVPTSGPAVSSGAAVNTAAPSAAAPTAVPSAAAPTAAAPTAVPSAAAPTAPVVDPSYVPTETVAPVTDETKAQYTLDANKQYKMSFTSEDGSVAAVDLNPGVVQVFADAVTKLVTDESGDVVAASKNFAATEYKGDEYNGVKIEKAKDSATAKVETINGKKYDLSVAEKADAQGTVAVELKNEATGADSIVMNVTKNEGADTYKVTDFQFGSIKTTGEYTATAAVENGNNVVTLVNAQGESFVVSAGDELKLDIPKTAMDKYHIGVLQ